MVRALNGATGGHRAGTVVSRFRSVSVAIALSSVTAIPSVLANERGVNPAFEIGSYKGLPVDEVRVRGVPSSLADSVSLGLELSRRSGLLGRDRPLLYETPLSRDVERVRLFLARHGFPRAAVQAKIDPDRKERKVTVDFLVAPGPPVRIGDVAVTNFPPAFEAQAQVAGAALENQRFSDSSVQTLERELNDLLLDGGHARSTVHVELIPMDSTTIGLGVAADPGAVYHFADYRVEGTRPDLVRLVEKVAGMEEGELYSPAALENAHDRLRLLDLFRQIRVEPSFPEDPPESDTKVAAVSSVEGMPIDTETAPVGSQDGTPSVSSTEVRPFDTRLLLANRDFRSLEIGVGYWTDDLFRGQIGWQHRNLLGRGRGFRARGFYSRFTQEVGSGLWWPAFPWSASRVELRGTVSWEEEESYRLEEQETDLSILWRPSLRSTYRAGFSFSRVDVDVLTLQRTAFLEHGGFVTLLFANWLFEHTDDRLDPHRGWITRLGGELSMPQLLSDAPYSKVEGSAVSYLPLPLGSVLVTRAGGGWAVPTGDAVDLLPNKRFYAGGLNSMRGFKRRYLGPLDLVGSPIGGNAMVEGAIETRFPIWGRLGGAIFSDAGQVWSRQEDVDLSEIEVAVGASLMVRTPIGPVRVDVGHRLTDIVPRQPDTVVHLAVGHPF